MAAAVDGGALSTAVAPYYGASLTPPSTALVARHGRWLQQDPNKEGGGLCAAGLWRDSKWWGLFAKVVKDSIAVTLQW
jgi:hypothetical protein